VNRGGAKGSEGDATRKGEKQRRQRRKDITRRETTICSRKNKNESGRHREMPNTRGGRQHHTQQRRRGQPTLNAQVQEERRKNHKERTGGKVRGQTT